MKKTFLILFLVSASIMKLSSQIDTTFIEPDFAIEPQLSSKPQKFFVSFYQNFWLDIDISQRDSMTLNDFQPSFAINYIYPIMLGNSQFAIACGLGMKVDNIRFQSDLISQDTIFYFNPQDTYKKQKLVLPYIYLPVEFSYTSKGENTFRLALGGFFGIKITDHLKQINADFKQKIYNIDNLEKYYYGVYMRIGYKIINLSINYNLSSVFVSNVPKNMHTLSLGLTLSLF